MNEPLVQTQVIPYLRELVKGGHELTLLTFEPGDIDENATREKLASDGIEWHWLRYHKRPSVPATLFDIANAVRFIRRLMNQHPFDILHARSHVPMMMAALARKASRHKSNLLFDIRGFMPEEYVDAGVWPEGGAAYRGVKRVERWLMKEADGFVVLTERAREILANQVGTRPLQVIPCCVDLERFQNVSATTRAELRAKLGIGERFTAAYVGALGGWYLTEETADLFAALRRRDPDAFALVLTQSDPTRLRTLLSERGFGPDDLFLGRVSSVELPSYLSAADVAVSFIKNCYSKQASSPTKNAEYLASGLPVIANAGIGDTDRHINEDGIGALVHAFDDRSYSSALDKIASLGDEAGERCRSSARKRFDLTTVGGAGYRRIYSALIHDTTLSE